MNITYFPVDLVSQFSPSVKSDSLGPHGLQHAWLPYSSPTPGACSKSCPSGRWCHPTISSSVVPFSSCLQSFPEPRSFPMRLSLLSFVWSYFLVFRIKFLHFFYDLHLTISFFGALGNSHFKIRFLIIYCQHKYNWFWGADLVSCDHS